MCSHTDTHLLSDSAITQSHIHSSPVSVIMVKLALKKISSQFCDIHYCNPQVILLWVSTVPVAEKLPVTQLAKEFSVVMEDQCSAPNMKQLATCHSFLTHKILACILSVRAFSLSSKFNTWLCLRNQWDDSNSRVSTNHRNIHFCWIQVLFSWNQNE